MNNGANNLDHRGRRHGTALRRAYILIIVLGLTAVVATLGWAFLDANSTVAPEAVNWVGAIRAQYLAGSGVAIATHYLMYAPTTVACGGYWTGASNVAIDSTSDYVDIGVVQSTGDPWQFTITAKGVAHNPDGSIRGKHTVTAQALRSPDPKLHLCQALVCTEGMSIPSTVRVTGDLHVNNGWLYSTGWCNGNVSATSTVQWYGSGPPASITASAPTLAVPAGTLAKYKSYTLGSSNYSAYTYSKNNMTSGDATTVNALSWPTTNPGRIIYVNSDFELKTGAVLNGTLVIKGNLQINGTGIQVTAVQDYPAIVMTGYIWFTNNSDAATINGSVICPVGIYDNLRVVNLTVNGTCIMGYGFNTIGTTDQIRFNWDANRSTFWDFENGTGVRNPMTLLSWQDD